MPNKFPVLPTIRRASVSMPTAHNLYEAFDACHERFLDCMEFRELQGSAIQETASSFILDFELTGRRTLGLQSSRFGLFRLLFLEERTATECCRLLNLDRFTLASELMTIKRLVGEAFVSRGLFPLHRYFTPAERNRRTPLAPVEELAA